MDHNISTGNLKIDIFLLSLGWIGAIISWDKIPAILSGVASLAVIINQYFIYKNRKKLK